MMHILLFPALPQYGHWIEISDESFDRTTSENTLERNEVLLLANNMYHIITLCLILQNQILQLQKNLLYRNMKDAE